MNSKIILIVAIVVIGVGAALFFVLGGDDAEPAPVRFEYAPGDFFTTNVSGGKDGSGSSRILKAAVVLVVNRDDMEDMLKLNNASIRDTIIFILRDLDEAYIRAPGNKDELRQRIITALNERLGIDNFIDVLFNDFVMA